MPPPVTTVGETVKNQSGGSPSAAQLSAMRWEIRPAASAEPQSVHGSELRADRGKLVCRARYSSYSAGVRNEVPKVLRTRNASFRLQLRPTL